MGNGVVHRDRARSAEFQSIGNDRIIGNKVLYYPVPRDENGLPNWKEYTTILAKVEKLHDAGSVLSSSVV